MDAEDDEEDARKEELDTLSFVYPEMVRKSPYSIELDLNIHLADPLQVIPYRLDTKNKTQGGKSKSYEAFTVTNLPSVRVSIELPVAYPAKSPPNVVIDSYWLNPERIHNISIELVRLWDELRDQCVYNIIDNLVQKAEKAFGIPNPYPASGDLCKLFLDYNQSAVIESFQHQTFECGICQNYLKGALCYSFRNCGHVFCRECLISYYKMCIEQGMTNQVRCPDTQCVKSPYLEKEELQEIVGPDLTDRFLYLRRQLILETDPRCICCPRTGCLELNIRDPDDKLVVCKKCRFAFCYVCKRTWHGYHVACRMSGPASTILKSYKAGTDKERYELEFKYGRKNLEKLIRQLEEQEAVDEYIKANTQSCPTCQVKVERMSGCNKMICSRCQTFFCYLCGSYLDRDNPYQHFNNMRSPCNMRLFEGLVQTDDGPENGEIVAWAFGAA